MKTNTFTKLALASFLSIASSGYMAEEGFAEFVEHDEDVEVRVTTMSDHTDRTPVTFLGMEVTTAQPALAAQLQLPEGQGLVVRFVVPESPAAEAGLEKHDVLLRLDDQILIEPRQLSVLVRGHEEGDTITLVYLRAGKENRARVTLAKRKMKKQSFHWRSADPQGFHFHGEARRVDPHAYADGIHQFENRMEEFHQRMQNVPRSPEAPNVMIFRPDADIVLSDEEGEMRLKTKGGRQTLVVRDKMGNEVFSGPIDSKEDRDAVPGEFLERLEKLERMEIVAPPAVPVPPVAPVNPMPNQALDVGSNHRTI